MHFKKTTTLPSPRDRWERLQQNPATLSAGDSGASKTDGWMDIFKHWLNIFQCRLSCIWIRRWGHGCQSPFQLSAGEGGVTVWTSHPLIAEAHADTQPFTFASADNLELPISARLRAAWGRSQSTWREATPTQKYTSVFEKSNFIAENAKFLVWFVDFNLPFKESRGSLGARLHDREQQTAAGN